MSAIKAKLVAVMVLVVSGVAGTGALALTALAGRSAEISAGDAQEGERASADTSPRTDRFGDPLPPGASIRLGSRRLRHKTSIRSTAFAAGGSVLIAAGDDELVRFWDPATGKELRHINGSGAIACSPDGKTLATLGGDSVALWDVATGKELRELRRRAGKPGGTACPLLFAPDGRAIRRSRVNNP